MDDPIWTCIELGDVRGMLARFSAGKNRPDDIDDKGQSLVLYSIRRSRDTLDVTKALLQLLSRFALAAPDKYGRSTDQYCRRALYSGKALDDTHGHTYRRIVELCDDAKDGFESTPVHDAILCLNCLNLDQALRQEPTLLNHHDGTGFTPLHWAVLRDDISSISTLLSWKADINCRDVEGNTPLHIACRSTKLQSVKLLLSSSSGQKCAVSLPNSFGSTPLYIAAESLLPDSDTIIQLLLESGASANDDGYFGHPLHIFTRQIVVYRDLIHAPHMIRKLELLITAHGADINSRDDRMRAPVHWACRVAWPCPYFRMLCEAGADVSVVDANGRSVLHRVALHGCAGIVNDMMVVWTKTMPECGLVDVAFRRDKSGQTPLKLLTWARGATETELEMMGAVRPGDDMMCSMVLLLVDIATAVDLDQNKSSAEFRGQMRPLIGAAVRYGDVELFRQLAKRSRSLPVGIFDEAVDEQGRTAAEIMAWRKDIGDNDGLPLGMRKPTPEEMAAFRALIAVVEGRNDGSHGTCDDDDSESLEGASDEEFFNAESERIVTQESFQGI